jgi:hypothetical protein
METAFWDGRWRRAPFISLRCCYRIGYGVIDSIIVIHYWGSLYLLCNLFASWHVTIETVAFSVVFTSSCIGPIGKLCWSSWLSFCYSQFVLSMMRWCAATCRLLWPFVFSFVSHWSELEWLRFRTFCIYRTVYWYKFSSFKCQSKKCLKFSMTYKRSIASTFLGWDNCFCIAHTLHLWRLLLVVCVIRMSSRCPLWRLMLTRAGRVSAILLDALFCVVWSCRRVACRRVVVSALVLAGALAETDDWSASFFAMPIWLVC